ncbi:MAG: ATP-binding region ATPase domain protein, partial [Geminicoccaceae bacterium]|nr:ATP-binding region ATPase domain protein [Geminicoccaceae bacterium]
MRPRAPAPGRAAPTQAAAVFRNDDNPRNTPPLASRQERTTFTTSRLAEFCSVKELAALTGTASSDWPLMVVRELVDNALDACEEHAIAPVIRVAVARGRIRVRDNGPGIPPETVVAILDFSTRTSSRAGYISPSRGQQGNAVSTVIALPFALSGDEGRVEIAARGIRHEILFAGGLNWSPALDPTGDHFRLDSQLSGTYCGPSEPIAILAHLICPRPEFLDRGKSSLAHHAPGFAAVREAVEQVTKDWAKQRLGEIRSRVREHNREE